MSILDDLEAAEKAATPGPWANDGRYLATNEPYPLVGAPDGDYHSRVADCAFYGAWGDEQCHANAAFIALSRNALPALLRVARAAEGLLAQVPSSIDDQELDDTRDALAAALAALDKEPRP